MNNQGAESNLIISFARVLGYPDAHMHLPHEPDAVEMYASQVALVGLPID
jgi:hypothetical protein